ncbi:GNAT family N-acetyltransferase [Candidatus Altiarchaeota archaeon]
MSLIDSLHVLKKSDYGAASRTLANSFSEKPMIKKLGIRPDDLQNMFKMMIRVSLKYGEIYGTSQNIEGVLVFLPDKYAKMTLWQLVRSGAIIPALRINRQLMNILKETSKIFEEDKKSMDIGPYIYLLAMGVSQPHQGNGFGGKLMKALIEKADNEKNAIYLETDTEENVSLYKHYGFKVSKEVNLPSLNIPMWEMIREAKN